MMMIAAALGGDSDPVARLVNSMPNDEPTARIRVPATRGRCLAVGCVGHGPLPPLTIRGRPHSLA
jgi:hypothetical protein